MQSKILGISIDYEYISWTIIDSYYLKVLDVGRREIKYKNKNLGKESKQARKTKFIKLLQSYNLKWDLSEYPMNEKKSYFYSLRKKGLDFPLTENEIINLLYYFLLNRGIESNEKKNMYFNGNRTYGEYITEKNTEEKNLPCYRCWIKDEIKFLLNRQWNLGVKVGDKLFLEKYFNIFDFEKTTKNKLVNINKKDSTLEILLKSIDNKSFNKDKVVYGIIKEVCELIFELLTTTEGVGLINLFVEYDDEAPDCSDKVLVQLIHEYKNKFHTSPKKDDLIKLYLYNEQNHICIYSGRKISFMDIFNSDMYEVDHIVARSRGGSNSLSNKALVEREINREKDDLLLYEYINLSSDWINFKKRINEIYKDDNLKKRNLLLQDLTEYKPEININSSQKNHIYKIMTTVNDVLSRSSKGVIINCIKSEKLLKDMVKLLKNDGEIVQGDKGYIYSFVLSNIDSSLISTYLSIQEGVEDSKVKDKIRNSFFYNEVDEFNQIIKQKNYSKKNYFIKKKLTEITKADLNLIDETYLNKDLIQLIKLRMNQYNFDAKKAFEEEVYIPSKDWNGTTINKIKIKVTEGEGYGQAIH